MPAPTKQPRQLVPKLRFQGFEGEWEMNPMQKIFHEVNESVGDREIDTYSITAGYGFVSQKEKFGRNISGQQNSKYTVLNAGQFTYNKGNSKTYKYGCVYVNTLGKPIAVPNVFISFELLDKQMIANFFAKLFESHYLDRGLRRIISSSARMDGLLNVAKASFFKLLVAYPKPPEQQKIADFLTAVDTWIDNLVRQKEALEAYKKGMMQKIFSQEIRFKDKDGKEFPTWEEKKLSEICECLDSKRKPLNQTERNRMKGEIPYYGANGIVDYLDTYLFNEELVLLAEDGGNFDDFTTRPIAQLISGKSWVNNHAHVLRANSSVISTKYLFFSLVHRDIRKYIVGGGRAKLNKSDLLSIKIYLPSTSEQKKTTEYLTSIGVLLEHNKAEIEKAEQWQKGLLQQLFV